MLHKLDVLRPRRRTNQNFYTCMMPSYYFEMIVGILNFRIKGPTDKITFQQINIKNPYKILFYVFYLFISIYKLLNEYPFQNSNDTRNVFNWFLRVYQIHCDVILQLLLCLGAYLNRNMMLHAWKQMLRIDENMAQIQIYNNNFYIRNAISVWIAYNLILNYVVHFISMSNTKTEDKFIYFILNMGKISIATTYMSWLLSLNERFYNLCNAFKKCNYTVLPTYIIQIRDIHKGLCCLLVNFNKIFSLPIIMNLSIDFYVIFSEIFIVFDLHKRDTLAFHDWVITGFMAYSIIDILSVVLVASNLIRNINLMKQECLKLFIASGNINLRKEVFAFSIQLLHNDVSIRAGNCIIIDTTLLYAMISTGATYIFLLVQFNEEYNL